MNRIAWAFLLLILSAWLAWTLSGMRTRVDAINTVLRADQDALETITRQWIEFHQSPTERASLASDLSINHLAARTGIDIAAFERTHIVLILHPDGFPPDRAVPIGWTEGLEPDGYWSRSPYPGGGFLLLSDGTVAFRDGGRDVEYLLRTPDGAETPDPLKAVGPRAIAITSPRSQRGSRRTAPPTPSLPKPPPPAENRLP